MNTVVLISWEYSTYLHWMVFQLNQYHLPELYFCVIAVRVRSRHGDLESGIRYIEIGPDLER